MKWDEKTDEIDLSTGRRFCAFDAAISAASVEICTHEATPSLADFTPEERVEIAEYMIARWKKWAGMDKP